MPIQPLAAIRNKVYYYYLTRGFEGGANK